MKTNTFAITIKIKFEAQYRHFNSKLLDNFSGQRLDEKIQEKRSDKRNRDTFAAVLNHMYITKMCKLL